MVTIRDHINKTIVAGSEIRLPKLIAIKAPQVIIDRQREIISLAKENKIVINGDQEALDLTFKSYEILTGRDGKEWVKFLTEENITVNYFPNARYSRFIKIEEKKNTKSK